MDRTQSVNTDLLVRSSICYLKVHLIESLISLRFFQKVDHAHIAPESTSVGFTMRGVMGSKSKGLDGRKR